MKKDDKKESIHQSDNIENNTISATTSFAV